MKARWWQKENEFFTCGLCFRSCRLKEGETGFCGVRSVREGQFISPVLGQFCSLAIDPIEKKPLYHWRPGSSILSLGSVGCTMNCLFCQNHSIAHPQEELPLKELTIDFLAVKIKELGQTAIAYTYNEPTLQAEYILQVAPVLSALGVATVLVTNAMMSKEVAKALATVSSAVNIDVKSFNPANYTRLGGSLEVLKRNVHIILEAGVHVELSTLLVPEISDDENEFAAEIDWIAQLSPDIPLHISRYFPAYKYSKPMTDLGLMHRFKTIAEAKLRHVHLGNVR